MTEENLVRALIQSYLESAREIINHLNVEEIEGLARAINEVREEKGTVFLVGNGGSASTASHFATDLGVGSINASRHVRVMSLTDNVAAMTAISNDKNYESVFSQQLQLLGKKKDLLVLISASGNSKNLIAALNSAEAIGMKSFSLTGFDGGELRRLTSNNNVHVPSKIGEYGLVEDAHLAICHMITECIRAK
jgi:D-sedoheptulose 7-phosphate isomerase